MYAYYLAGLSAPDEVNNLTSSVRTVQGEFVSTCLGAVAP